MLFSLYPVVDFCHLCSSLSYLFLSSFIVRRTAEVPLRCRDLFNMNDCVCVCLLRLCAVKQQFRSLQQPVSLSSSKEITSVQKINFSIDGWFGRAVQSQLVFGNLEQNVNTSKGSQCTETLTASFCVCFQLNEMIRAPVEGDFWQVDHIRPVYSGGGQCSLDNLQTLCTVCHKAVRARSASLRP